MTNCDIRIVPHAKPLTNDTWYRVQVKKTIFRAGSLRLWIWRTIGDYPSLFRAKASRSDIMECYEENHEE